MIDEERRALAEEREALAKDNRLRRRIGSFAERITATMDSLDFGQRQKLLRLVIEQVRVTGWDVAIRLRLPLDERPPDAPPPSGPGGVTGKACAVMTVCVPSVATAGSGLRLFEEGGPGRHLTLISSQPFRTGVVYLVYGPDPNPPTGSYDEAKESLPQQ